MQNDRSEFPGSTRHSQALQGAMHYFWMNGYEASAMSALVAASRSNRAALYETWGDKRGLFIACLKAYSDLVVTPAFAPLEEGDADLKTIRAYFMTQIDLAESMGLPGPGCLMANSMTEIAPHDDDVRRLVEGHYHRLAAGFYNALSTDAAAKTSKKTLRDLSDFIAINAQGLWSHSRTVSNAKPLRAHVTLLLALIKDRLI